MFHRQLGEPLTVGEEHRARNDGERSGTIPDQSGEGRLERGGASHGDGFYGETYGAGGGFGLVHSEPRRAASFGSRLSSPFAQRGSKLMRCPSTEPSPRSSWRSGFHKSRRPASGAL